MFCVSTPYLFFIVHFDNAEHPLLVFFVVFDVGVTLRFASWYFTLSLHCVTARCGGRVCHFLFGELHFAKPRSCS